MHFSVSTFLVTYLYQLAEMQICDKFVLNFVLIQHQNKKNYAGTSPSSGPIWEESSEQQ